MNILHTVESYYPAVGGMQEVVRQLSERLVALGHDVTVATSKRQDRFLKNNNGVKIVEFAVAGNYVQGMQGEVDNYRNFLLNGDYDVIVNFAAQQWATDIALPVLALIKAKKIFVPTGFSGLYRSEYQDYFTRMRSWIKNYDANVFLSENYRDINFAREFSAKNIIVIPNGASEEEFYLVDGIDEFKFKYGVDSRFIILLVGSLNGAKGHYEAIRIFSKIRAKNCMLLLVYSHNDFIWKHFLWNKFWQGLCNILGCLSGKHIKMLKLSRVDTIKAFHVADLFLFPSRIECSPLVLFECCASRTPFLVSDVGNAREIIQWTNAGVVLPTEKDRQGYSHVLIKGSAVLLEKMIYDIKLRNLLADSGYKAWNENFTWGLIAKKYELLYERLMRE